MAWNPLAHPWGLETASLFACVIQVVAMIAVCLSFNGKPVLDWPIVTLNTIISVLSTGSKASMLTAVSSCIGQANWHLFAGPPRRLYDFEMVSDASRGPLGSLQLLWNLKFKGGVIVRVGAFITILAIAMDPFAQQLVHIDQTQRQEMGGTFPRAVRYAPTSYKFSATVSYALQKYYVVSTISTDVDMRAAVMLGLTSKKEQILQQTGYNCPGSHCQFSNITSLSICSKCTNVDTFLQKRNVSEALAFQGWPRGFGIYKATPLHSMTEYSLPNGLALAQYDGSMFEDATYMATLGTSYPNKTMAMKNIESLIWSQSMIKMDNSSIPKPEWPEVEIHATECGLYYCVKNYSFEVQNGTVAEVSADVVEGYNRTSDSWKWKALGNATGVPKPSPDLEPMLSFHSNFSLYDRTDFQLSSQSGNQEVFNASQYGIEGISSYIQSMFAACRLGANCSNVVEDWDSPTGYLAPHSNSPDASLPLWNSDNLTVTFENIATSMSNAVRMGDESQTVVTGKVLSPVTVYRIRWPWIGLHIIILVAAFVLFVLTCFLKHPLGGVVPVWKTSQLAVLARGMVVSDILKDAQTLDQLEKRAKEAPVVLIGSEEEHPLMKVNSK